jgi:coenzyme F420-reducing hydrogenase beta subunit
MVCPVHAIVMKQDEEGFPYPSIENDVCIHCDACRRVCPILAESSKERKTEPFHPSHVYAVRNNDDKVRKQSSSGGVFVPLCEFILQQQGVVYGCVMDYGADGPKAKHVRATTRQEVTAMMGSKYLQSEIGDCYRLVKQDLQDGKHVLFSGTPCQIAGLQHFLLAKNDVGKSQVSDTIHEAYPLLVTVAVVCHGVPSPLVFKKYVNETILQTR